MRRALVTALPVFLLTLAGCGASARPIASLPPATPPGTTLPTPPKFASGLAAMAQHDRAGDWSEPVCRATSASFLDGPAGESATARYNAGVALQRCHLDAEAGANFRDALTRDPHLIRAKIALATQLAGAGGDGLDRAIAATREAVIDARFADVDALVTLATLEARRGNDVADDEGRNDRDRARKNLQRALAIDDGSLTALNQLAIVHLEEARRAARSGPRGKRADTQALELGALICSQALRKSPSYPPLLNTLGLIEAELGNFSQASAAFDKARTLDPSFFDAQLNFASLILSFRGFAEAEQAYRVAARLRPRDYDVHLGLSLAIRGQIEIGGDPARLTAADQELEIAKAIAPERPEAYFNQALLAEDFGARSEKPEVVGAELTRATKLLATFLEKAGTNPSLEGARKKAKERLDDIRQLTDSGFAGKRPELNPAPPEDHDTP